MSKRIYFNAFHMNCVVHQSPGLWVRRDDKMHEYTKLANWVELAKLLERGKLDALFLATWSAFMMSTAATGKQLLPRPLRYRSTTQSF